MCFSCDSLQICCANMHSTLLKMERQQELCAEVNKRAPSFLESGQWTDCKFVVGAEPHQVVVGGYKLVMAMASPVFEAMFYGGLAETKDHIPILDVEPEIFKAMLQYIYTGNINLSSCKEASELCYTAKKYLLHHLVDECSNYLWNNVNLENVCQIYEYSQLFEDEVLTQKCIDIFTDKTKELLQGSSFKDAALATVEKIFSLNELNVDSEVEMINAAALYASTQDNKAGKIASGDEPSTVSYEDISMIDFDNSLEGASDTKGACEVAEQPIPGTSNITNDTVNKQQIRSVVNHIRFLTLTPQQYTDCAARTSLLTTFEDHAVFVNIVSNNSSVPMPSGLSTSRVHREKIDKARSEATFRYTVQNISSLESEEMSPVFYVRNLPWQIKTMPKVNSSQQVKSLGFFVQCSTESDSSNWSCSASVELRLICHKPGAEPFVKSFQHLYTKTEYDWGFSHFLSWNTVLDPTREYIQDDAITLEVHMTAEEPHGVI